MCVLGVMVVLGRVPEIRDFEIQKPVDSEASGFIGSGMNPDIGFVVKSEK